MEPVMDDYYNYLEQLSSVHQVRYNVLIRNIAAMNIFGKQTADTENGDNTEKNIAPFIFLPVGTHPLYTDTIQVFAKAVFELALREPRLPLEIPIAFVGCHDLNRFTRSRQSLGFLLTDQSLYVQDDYNALFEQQLPRVYPLPRKPEDISLFLKKIFTEFHGDGELLDPVLCPKLQQIIAALLNVVLLHHNQFHSFIETDPETVTFDFLLRTLNLQEYIQNGQDEKQQKYLSKVAQKFLIPEHEPILYATTDKPLFGGAYGFAVTKEALYSKDLFEPPACIPLAALASNRGLRLSDDKKNIQMADGSIIFLPAYIKEPVREKIIGLIQGSVALIFSGRFSN